MLEEYLPSLLPSSLLFLCNLGIKTAWITHFRMFIRKRWKIRAENTPLLNRKANEEEWEKEICEAGRRPDNWGYRSFGGSTSRERIVLYQMMLSFEHWTWSPCSFGAGGFTLHIPIKDFVWHLLVLNTCLPSFLLLMASGSALRFMYQIPWGPSKLAYYNALSSSTSDTGQLITILPGLSLCHLL